MPTTEQEWDWDSWAEYLKVCEQDGTEPSLRDYLIWLDEAEDVS